MVSVDVKHHETKRQYRAQERSRGGRWSWAVIAGWIVLLGSQSHPLDFHLHDNYALKSTVRNENTA